MFLPSLLLGVFPFTSSSALATNYLVVIADDFGADKVGAYADDFDGYRAAAQWLPATPTLDTLAGTGLRFTRAWANPVCSPTRVTIQTGEYAFRSDVGRPLADGTVGPDWMTHTMLADVMRDNGYATGLFGKWHLGAQGSAGTVDWAVGEYRNEVPNAVVAGYDRFDGFPNATVNGYSDWRRLRHVEGLRVTEAWNETDYSTLAQGEAALAWINQQTGPWFGMLAFNAPHVEGAGPFRYSNVDPSCVQSPALLDCVEGRVSCDEPRATYAALVECMDTSLGDVLAGMDPAVLDDTLIIFMGDNGTQHWVSEWRFADPELDGVDNYIRRGKDSVSESGINVPLLVTDGRNYAGDPTEGLIVSPGRTVPLPVSVMCGYNTVIRLATGARVDGVDSRSFNECFRETDARCGRAVSPAVYSEAWHSETEVLPAEVDRFMAALRKGDHVITVLPGIGADGSLCRAPAMYDTSTDYWELTPLTDAAMLVHFEGMVDDLGVDWMTSYPWC